MKCTPVNIWWFIWWWVNSARLFIIHLQYLPYPGQGHSRSQTFLQTLTLKSTGIDETWTWRGTGNPHRHGMSIWNSNTDSNLSAVVCEVTILPAVQLCLHIQLSNLFRTTSSATAVHKRNGVVYLIQKHKKIWLFVREAQTRQCNM